MENDKLPEIFQRCACGDDVYIPEGEMYGRCFNEECYSCVRRDEKSGKK